MSYECPKHNATEPEKVKMINEAAVFLSNKVQHQSFEQLSFFQHIHRHTSRGLQPLTESGKAIFLGAIAKFCWQKTAAENEKINIFFKIFKRKHRIHFIKRNKVSEIGFYRAMLAQSAVMRQ